MGNGRAGFKQGAGFSFGCCATAIAVPILVLIGSCVIFDRGVGAMADRAKARDASRGTTKPKTPEFITEEKERQEQGLKLKAAADLAKAGKEDGMVQVLEEFAGVRKGDRAGIVLQNFGAPATHGSTDNYRIFATAWPGLEYYSYDDQDVTFMVKNGAIEIILVGLVTRDEIRS